MRLHIPVSKNSSFSTVDYNMERRDMLHPVFNDNGIALNDLARPAEVPERRIRVFGGRGVIATIADGERSILSTTKTVPERHAADSISEMVQGRDV